MAAPSRSADATDDRSAALPPGGGWREAGLALLALALFTGLGMTLLHDTLWGPNVLSASQTMVVRGPYTDAMREGLSDGDERFGDSYRHFEPWMRFAADAWDEHGYLPLWKDHTMLGAPLLGNGQSALLFPPNLIAAATGAPPSSAGWLGLVKLVLGALSAWALARHLACSFVASLVAGLAFGFFGFGVVFLLWPLSNVSCLAPLVVLAALRAAERPRGGRLVALALACALQHLGGHPETALLTQLTAFILGARRARARLGGLAPAARRMARVACGFGLGALLAGPQLVPLVEYLLLSDALATRAAEHDAGAPPEASIIAGFLACLAVGALAARRLVQVGRAPLPWALLLLATLVGGARLAMEVNALTDISSFLVADWLGGTERHRLPSNYIEGAAVYAGPALALALAGLLLGAPRRAARLWTLVLLVALLIRARAPGVLDLVQAIPVVGLMPAQRAGLVAQLAVAVLAALGYDALARPLSDPRTRQRYAALVLVPLLAAGAAMAWGTAAGVTSVGSVTGRNAKTSLPLKVELAPAGPLGRGPAIFRGSFHAPREVGEVRVHWSRRAPPMPAAAWRQHAADKRGGGRYNFEVELPRERIPSITAMLRVEVDLVDGRHFSSPALRPRADLITILSSVPVMPVDGQAGQQLLLLLAMAAGVTLVMGRAPGGALSSLRPALLVLAAGGVVWFTDAQLPRTPAERFWPDSPALAFMAEAAPDGRILTAKSSWMAESLGYYRIPQVLGHDAVVPQLSARLLREAVAPGSEGLRYRDLPGGLPADDRLVDLLAARAALGPASDFRVFFYDGYERGQRLEVFVNDSWLPRARLVARARVEPDDDAALALLHDPDFDPVTELVLAEGEPLEAQVAPGAREAGGRATILLSEPDRVLVEVEPELPTYLLLADSYFPGWVALVDGEPRPIRRADVALRAVRVEPGERRVDFRYEPGSLRLGLGLGALGAVACLALVLRRRND